MDEFAAHSSLLAVERAFRLSSERDLEIVSQPIAALARTPVADLGLQETAFLASQRFGETLAAGERRVRSMIELPEAARIAAEAVSPRLSGLAAAEAALRDPNHATFLRSTDMLRALVESAAALPDRKRSAQSGFQITLQAVRLNQDHLNSIVEGLATAKIADLQPQEAKGVAIAFEEAVVAQTSVTDAPRGDQVVLEGFSERCSRLFWIVSPSEGEWASHSQPGSANRPPRAPHCIGSPVPSQPRRQSRREEYRGNHLPPGRKQ